MLMAMDQSVRGFAIAWAPTFWAGNWKQVNTVRFDGGKVERKNEAGALARLHRVFRFVDGIVCGANPNVVGFESYGFSANPDVHVVELVGALKLRLIQYDKKIETVQQSTARKLVCREGKVPRKGDDAKKMMHRILTSHGAPATLSLDETDALVVLNAMMHTHGGQSLVP
jgi:Holliday junction resolvasome RuvABC endonuclease subunit